MFYKCVALFYNSCHNFNFHISLVRLGLLYSGELQGLLFGMLFVCNFLSLLLDDLLLDDLLLDYLPIFGFPDGLVFMFIFVVSVS